MRLLFLILVMAALASCETAYTFEPYDYRTSREAKFRLHNALLEKMKLDAGGDRHGVMVKKTIRLEESHSGW